MAIEIFGNVIRVTNSDDTPVQAIIKDSTGAAITTGVMKLVIPDMNASIIGTYSNNVWNFEIPKNPEIKGRHDYHFENDGIYLDFSSAIYFE